MPDNPLLPDIDSILSQYTPEELRNYRARGMVDSRGIPTIPPGGKFNSRGEPISNDLFSMTPQEKSRIDSADRALRSGTFWGNSNSNSSSNPPPNNLAPPPKSDKMPWQEAAALVKKYESRGGDYNIGWGGTDLSNFPLNEYGFPIWKGKSGPQGNSRAAGAYQFEPGTWERYAIPLGIKDFSPESQDKVFKAAYEAEGFGPWEPYNAPFRAALHRGERVIDLKTSGDLDNAKLSGTLSSSPLSLPNSDQPSEKANLANAISKSPNSTSSISPLLLLSLLSQYKVTPINYDPWKYVPKVT